MAITVEVIAAFRKCNMASQFRFGYLAVTNYKIKISQGSNCPEASRLGCRIYAIVPGNVIVTLKKRQLIPGMNRRQA
jgi:hypothetical protein